MWAKTVNFANATRKRTGLANLSGSTASEYALIGTGIGVAIIAAVFLIGDELIRLFELVVTTLADSGN